MSDTIIEIGKTYRVNHSRKGQFLLLVDYISKDGNWIGGRIVDGKVHYMRERNRPFDAAGVETATVSRQLATFEEANDAETA